MFPLCRAEGSMLFCSFLFSRRFRHFGSAHKQYGSQQIEERVYLVEGSMKLSDSIASGRLPFSGALV